MGRVKRVVTQRPVWLPRASFSQEGTLEEGSNVGPWYCQLYFTLYFSSDVFGLISCGHGLSLREALGVQGGKYEEN